MELDNKWVDYGSFKICTHEQGSEEWLEARKQCVVTASRFHEVYRHMRFFKDPPNMNPIIPNEAMIFGTLMESSIRDWFAKTYNLEIIEAGLAIPKWCPEIGSSVDGIIIKDGKFYGLLEIKTCARHKPELLEKKGTPRGYISPWHYAQTQGGMAILDLSYCFYVSFSRETNLVQVVTIPRDRDYWDKELYVVLQAYIDKTKNKNYPL
jgi:hypothetical protein